MEVQGQRHERRDCRGSGAASRMPEKRNLSSFTPYANQFVLTTRAALVKSGASRLLGEWPAGLLMFFSVAAGK